MKKFLGALFILVLLALPVGPVSAATTPTTKSVSGTAKGAAVTPVPTPTTTKPDYPLPYPGIHVDHPLYFLKRLRDNIMESLISDPAKKIEFYVLQSDKHLSMAQAIVGKGNEGLAATVVTLSWNFMDKAYGKAEEAKAAGIPLPGYLAERLIRSSEKHLEVLTDLAGKATNPSLKEAIEQASAETTKIQAAISQWK